VGAIRQSRGRHSRAGRPRFRTFFDPQFRRMVMDESRSLTRRRPAARRGVRFGLWGAVPLLLAAVSTARGEHSLVRVTFTTDADRVTTVEGKIVVTAEDGGLLLLGRDGQLWNVTPRQLRQREQTERDFEPLPPDELGRQLIAELGAEFTLVKTRHYLIVTSADREYARWCGSLFERLMASFIDFWKARGLDLSRPDFPLVAIVLPDQQRFAEFAARDAGEQAQLSHGYYSMRTNHMVLYDLTADSSGKPARTPAEMRGRLENAAFNVATVVHEATHQIAFNCGMHTRFADNPLWLTEGMAMFFETPDLRSRAGWRTIGKVNWKRSGQFRDFLRQRRQPDSLATPGP